MENLLSGPLGKIGGLIALILLGRKRAAWLAVPVLWPATQLHYRVLALPAMTPSLALAGSVAEPGFMTAGVMSLALWERRTMVATLAHGLRSKSASMLAPRARKGAERTETDAT